jgi:hypothetical protein
LQPLRPFHWQFDEPAGLPGAAQRLVEIPVTTLPILRTPIHLSYLLYLFRFSRSLAWAYWRLAMRLCQSTGLGPSLLLHPLDFLGQDDEPDLAFFPAMDLNGDEKTNFVRQILADYVRRFQVVPVGDHAAAAQENELAARQVPVAPCSLISASGGQAA